MVPGDRPGNPTSSTPPDDTTVSRRQLLAAVGTSTVTALAGCEDTIDPIPPEDQASLTLRDVRVVQVVEDTQIQFGAPSLDDPPLVADEYAVVLFNLDVTQPDNLPNTVPVTVSTPTTNYDYTHVLSKTQIQSIDAGGDPAAVFHQSAHANLPGDPPDPQRLPADIQEITVSIVENNVDGDETTLTAGPNGDFQVTTVPTLRVGFIHVKDPGDASSPVYPTQSAATDQGDQYTTDIDWGDSNGEAANYERSVRSSLTYLRRVFPGKVVAYSHDVADPMIACIRENWSDGTGKDAARARRSLNWIRTFSSFPTNGTIHTDGDITTQQARDMMDASQGGAFDVRVMILPRGTSGNHQHYFAAHGMPDTIGYFWSKTQAVASLEGLPGDDDNTHVQITAQEIGHRYAFGLYTNQFAAGPNDQRHANNSVVSVGFDLSDGTYTLINDWSVTDGTFDFRTDLTDPGEAPEIVDQTSYMQGTAGEDGWADAQIHRYLINGAYTPGYNGSPRIPRPDTDTDSFRALQTETSTQQAREVQPVFEAFGSIEDDTVDIHSSTVYDATPESVGEYDPTRHPNATPVSVTIEAPTDDVLATATVPDIQHGTHADTRHNSVPISIPFPERGVTLRTDRDGVTTTVNPIVHPVRDAINRVPAAAFDQETDRERLRADLATVDARMTQQDFTGARQAFETFIEHVDTDLNPDYQSTASQPTPETVANLTDRMLTRLETLAQNTQSETTYTLVFPDGTIDEIKPVKAPQPIEEYYGYGSGPSDSSNTPADLERDDATVTFLYRNTTTDRLSLVCLNGDATTSTDGGGNAVMTFEGFSGAEWLVQDGPPGSGFGDQDPYQTPDGALGDTESVIWGWDDSKTDGGAIGPIDDPLDTRIIHRQSGTVQDTTQQRQGLDEWVVIDGDNPESPITITEFTGETGDVTITLRTPD